jgi:hypothetical protein
MTSFLSYFRRSPNHLSAGAGIFDGFTTNTAANPLEIKQIGEFPFEEGYHRRGCNQQGVLARFILRNNET